MSTSRGRWISCAQCHTTIEPGAAYCPNCGQPQANAIGPACPRCATTNLPGNAYCEQCGYQLPAQPYLVVTNSGLRLPLEGKEETTSVVGRADSLSGTAPDLDLEPYGGDLTGLSRRHARLTWRDGQHWITDLNSVNWTYLNNQRLAPEQPMPLKDGDLLRLGNLLLTYRASERPSGGAQHHG